MKHGLSYTKIYGKWEGIVQRTQNPKEKNYKNYGGRGILLCPEWRDFINFYTWAISNGYNDNLTIDRINGDGNYEPNNCRWITQSENAKNVGSRKRNKNKDWGVYQYKNKRSEWVAQVWNRERGACDVSGPFKTKKEALVARDELISGVRTPNSIRPDKGVYQNKNGTYFVHVVKNKKCYHVGTYKTIEEAILARDTFIYPT